MLFRTTPVHAAVVAALAGLFVAPAVAQTAQPAASPQRIEITGSAIRRLAAEGALPVVTLSRDQIDKSGATSVADLIQALPSMQGFTNEGAAVGGGGNGFSGASLHNLGETRTLVLLNGRRLASFAGQYITGSLAGIDLNTIPISAIERVEILADGASALYGADAVGGVVNFITKRNTQGVQIDVGGTWPKKGAREKRVALSAGFGNLDADRWNVLVGANVEKRDKLKSTDREFAKTGVVAFELNGQPVTFFNGSPRGIPGNMQHDAGTPGDGSDDYLVNPYFAANGRCPDQHVALQEGSGGTACYYDFVQQLEIFPERERGSLYGQFQFKLGAGHTLFAELLGSKTENTNRVAPPPGEVSIAPTSPFWSYVLQGNPLQTQTTTVSYRVADVGQRTQIDETEARHAVVGVEGTFGRWDYNASLTRSVNKQTSDLAGGYVELGRFLAALGSGLVNPFVSPGNQSAAAQQALDDARILGFWEGGEFTLDFAQARVSTELARLAGGPLGVALGVSHGREQFEKSASAIAQGIGGTRFGDDAGLVPYTAKRDFTGVFAELAAPLFKGFEVPGAMRHDRYSDFGNANTAKLSARWQPTSSWLLRGSVGSGFKAPTVPQTSATRQLFGVTGAPYFCGPGSELAQIAAQLGAICPVGNVQYNIYAEGNRDLQPEKSRQWTIGMRFEPNSTFSVGVDVWQVKVKNAISQLDEATVMNAPLANRGSFTTYTDPGTQQTLLALYLPNRNLGDLIERGIDVDAQARFATPIGRWTTTLGLSYHLKSEYQLEPGGAFFTSLGQFGPDGNVVFRWQGRLINTLEHGNFAHTLTLAFKSGYADQTYTAGDFAVFDPNTFQSFAYNGIVDRYATLDWQTRWRFNDRLTFTLGVLNLTDKDPPRSFKTAGGGQQIGYDDRYYDPRGRSVYANVGLRF